MSYPRIMYRNLNALFTDERSMAVIVRFCFLINPQQKIESASNSFGANLLCRYATMIDDSSVYRDLSVDIKQLTLHTELSRGSQWNRDEVLRQDCAEHQ